MARVKTQAEKIADIPIEEIIRLSGPYGRGRLIEYARTLRTGYVRRVQQFKRQGLVSYAQLTLERSLPEKRQKIQLTKLTRNQLILEIVRYQKFFNSETATVAGIKKLNKEQDLRIFGEGLKKGRPAGTLTQDERIRYWDAYDEFKAQNAATFYRYGSSRIQDIVGSVLSANPELDAINLMKSTESWIKLIEMFQDDEAMTQEESQNVYSGKGPLT